MAADYDPIDQQERERARKDAKTRERLAQEREDADLRWLMSSRQGRRIVWRLLEKAKPTGSVMRPNALEMAYNEGFRNFGLWFQGIVTDACFDHYLQLLKEQNDERNTSGNGPNSK